MSGIDEKLLARINTLANKKKTTGLTKEETAEQQRLRAKYIEEFRKGFKSQLQSITVVDPEGNDVTPEKLKKEKMRKS